MEYNFPTDEQHIDLARDHERELAAAARYQAALHADPETGCTAEEMAAPYQEFPLRRIAVASTPVGIGYKAWVPDYEERYGTAYGDTLEAAREQMQEWMEEIDAPKLPRIEAKPVRFAETMQGNLFEKEVA